MLMECSGRVFLLTVPILLAITIGCGGSAATVPDPEINDDTPKGWAVHWGGPGADYAWKVAVGPSGEVYAAGAIQETADLNPGTDRDNHTTEGHWDAQLSRFDSDGNFVWGRTWGGEQWDWCRSVAVDNDGFVYVAGEFTETVDFDPGDGTDTHTSNGLWDAFVSKFDSDGNFLWARTWGGDLWEESLDVEISATGDVYVCGSMAGTSDFDPGPGEDIHDGFDIPDAFLVKFDRYGNYQWGHHWGSEGWDWATGVALDEFSNAYVTGSFTSTIDFDPGDGVTERTTNGSWDPYIVSFDPDGNYIWVQTWGHTLWDEGLEIVLGRLNNLYVTGFFEGVVDFDPGTGTDYTGIDGMRSGYVTNFSTDCVYRWSESWFVGPENYGYGLDTDSHGHVYVTGFFSGASDFDPTSGQSWLEAIGGADAYLTKFDSGGRFQWARSWGGFKTDHGLSVAISGEDEIYVCGSMGGGADLDPGPKVEIHESYGLEDSWLLKVPLEGLW